MNSPFVRFLSCPGIPRLAALFWLVGLLASASAQTADPARVQTGVFPPAVIGPMAELGAAAAVKAMGLGVNIGNTLENTNGWETGWGQPKITRELVKSIAGAGYRVVRLPVAWDTYARGGKIQDDKLARVAEVAGWIIEEAMFCVVNIHWDGGWIDSGYQEKFPSEVRHTFSPEARTKFQSYWTQIASYFKDWNEKLVFEGLNEESNFSQTPDPFITLAEVNQLFIDTVRGTGGNNARRILIIAGYQTDFAKTADGWYVLPEDKLADRLMLSVHYYTPSTFTLLDKDASWGKMRTSWGNRADLMELDDYFGRMDRYSKENGIPVFVGEYTVTGARESEQRIKWIAAVTKKCLELGFVPVLWDTGGDIKRKRPYGISRDLQAVLDQVRPLSKQ